MNERQKRFVAEYLKDLNATQAAIRAGYSKKTARAQGQRLLTIVAIADAVGAKAEKKLKAADITADMVLEGLWHEAHATGEGTTQSARVRALELVGKYHMLFVDRIEVRHTYSDMSDAELAAELARLKQPKPGEGRTTH
ncbi:MAG: terminase small subunit [Rhizobiaceae bacterium]|nr:terminase small subunit [Rhizobiaceae bacterium]MCV0408934.1 terminase small subunit [Rhizobiaceae bacterium]